MAVDEVRVRLRRKLEELVGVEEADLLMDRPPGGWDALVTKEWLGERLAHERGLTDERFRGLDERFRGIDFQFEALEHKLLSAIDRAFTAQTWRLITALFGAVGALAGSVALIAAAIRW